MTVITSRGEGPVKTPSLLRSDVYEGSRDDELAKSAVERKLDRFDPEVNVWLRDMRYEEKDDVIGWTYTKRTEPELITENLSCIADERKEVEFIPLNTRLESYSYQFNESTLF